MTTTFVDVVNEVLNYGFNDGPQINRGRIKDWVNEGQGLIARQVEGPEFQANTNVTMVPGQAAYVLPTGFLRIQDLSNPTYGYRLQSIDIQDYDLMNATQIQGQPRSYTLDQFNLLVYPTPSSADTLLMRFIQAPPDMVADTDVPTLSQAYMFLLQNYAISQAFGAEDDYEAAQFYDTAFTKGLQQYASDVQWRNVDRPRVVDGTWGARR